MIPRDGGRRLCVDELSFAEAPSWCVRCVSSVVDGSNPWLFRGVMVFPLTRCREAFEVDWLGSDLKDKLML